MTYYDPNILYAAGAVCWREIAGEIHVLMIHRTQRKDFSFPKGKVDPGELLPETCVRELWEETGLRASLGVPVGVSDYTLPSGKQKVVHYWAAHIDDDTLASWRFTPNDEVDEVEWLPIKRARRQLSYDQDRLILDGFAALAKQDDLDTFALIVLRHAKALDPSTYVGADSTRPLADRGLHQAQEIVGALVAWHPRKIISSSSLRCRQTVDPLARALGRKVTEMDSISQHAFLEDTNDIRDLVARRVSKRRTTVICSHGPVIPEIVREIADATGTVRNSHLAQASSLETGAFSVFHVSTKHPTGGLVAIESHEPLR